MPEYDPVAKAREAHLEAMKGSGVNVELSCDPTSSVNWNLLMREIIALSDKPPDVGQRHQSSAALAR